VAKRTIGCGAFNAKLGLLCGKSEYKMSIHIRLIIIFILFFVIDFI
jgi:hypothetical protein